MGRGTPASEKFALLLRNKRPYARKRNVGTGCTRTIYAVRRAASSRNMTGNTKKRERLNVRLKRLLSEPRILTVACVPVSSLPKHEPQKAMPPERIAV
jgi:hypothetical protein